MRAPTSTKSHGQATTKRSPAQAFKHYVEDQDGWKLVNRGDGVFAKDKEVQLYFGLVWFGSAFDVNREPNNGRAPVDFKVSIWGTPRQPPKTPSHANVNARQR